MLGLGLGMFGAGEGGGEVKVVRSSFESLFTFRVDEVNSRSLFCLVRSAREKSVGPFN